MANVTVRKVQLEYNNNDVFPVIAIDCLYLSRTFDATTGPVPVQIPYLNSDGKIETSFLPSFVDDVIELVTMSDTAPATTGFNNGDKYFNSSSSDKKIHTLVSGAWDAGETPNSNKIYVNLSDSKSYRWGGSSMTEVPKQIGIVLSVRAAASASDSVVPSEKAVRTEIDKKQDALTTVTGATVNGNSLVVISATTAGTTGIVKLSPDTYASVAASTSAVKHEVATRIYVEGVIATARNGVITIQDLQSDIENSASSGLGMPPTTDAVKTYVAQYVSGALASNHLLKARLIED